MTDHMFDRVQARLKERGLTSRYDLALTDVRMLDKLSASFLMTFDTAKGPPSNNEIAKWMDEKFPTTDNRQRVSARLDTVRLYPSHSAVTFIAERVAERRPVSAANNMLRAAIPNQYVDPQEQNTIWEVVQAADGLSFLVRKDGTSIDELVRMRQDALKGVACGRRSVVFAAIDSIPSAGGGFARTEIGDVVDFYDRGLIHRGRVTSVGASEVLINVDGSKFRVDPTAITTIREKAPKSESKEDDALRRYYANVYPGNPEMTKTVTPLSRQSVKPMSSIDVEPISVAASASPAPSDDVKKKFPLPRANPLTARVRGQR
jgi:hypothetical protein